MTRAIPQVRHAAALILLLCCFAFHADAASAESSLNGNTCITSENCFAVGASGQTGSGQILIQKWNGSAWQRSSYSNPSGAVTSRLNAVSCRSATYCMAVGSYVDSEGKSHPLAFTWNGTTWTKIGNPTPPGGSTGAELSAVTCPAGTTSCRAVGAYTDSGGKEQGLATLWNGSAWSLIPLPMPGGSTSSELSGAVCATGTTCQLVGSYLDGAGVRKPLSLRLNSGSWSVKATPLPAGSSSGRLEAVSCVSSNCLAVGSFVDASVTKTYAISYASEAWSLANPPVPGGATASRLTGVSCASATACVAAGSFDLGTRAQPIALEWNGSAWSEEALDAERLGSHAASFAAVSCSSSTACQAVGSLAYAEGGPNRAFAFGLVGQDWNPIGADGYQRKWSIAELPTTSLPKAAEKSDVACASSSFCMRVGAIVNGATSTSRVKTWNGSSWTTPTIPSPGGTSSELTGVACISSTSCRAVGNFTSSGVVKAYALGWNGSTWSIQTMAVPAGASATRVSSVACTTVSDCRAVGSYVASGVTKNLAMAWNGSAWTVTTTPIPSGAKSSELSGIACTASSACRAVGSYVDSGSVTKTLGMAWNGTAWSIATTPNPIGAKESKLTDVSCLSTTFCIAVGKKVTSESKIEPLAERWSGSSWVLSGFNEAIMDVELDGVSCRSTTECRAVGQFLEGSGESQVKYPAVFRYEDGGFGAKWEEEFPMAPSSGSAQAAAISCQTSTIHCIVVGTADYADGAREELAFRFEVSEWSVIDPATVKAWLLGADCPSTSLCLSVGQKLVDNTSEQRAWKRSGKAWTASTPPAVSQSSLEAVDCTDATHCTAVGGQAGGALALRWNGSAWSTQTTPNPSGGSLIGLTSVSCPTIESCTAVGTYSAAGVVSTFFVERWDGTAWSLESPPVPANSNHSLLLDISCTSASYCIAVGGYVDAGAWHAFAHRWNGKTWRIYQLPAGSAGPAEMLRGVSCTTSSKCTVVGESGTEPYAAQWNGSSWTAVPATKAAGADSSFSSDISCVASTKCLAAGAAEASEAWVPFLMGWDGKSWFPEAAPTVPGATHSRVYGVTCSTAVDCVAVGSKTKDRSAEIVFESSESSTEAPDTAIASGPSGKVGPSVNFMFTATEAGAGFECSLDAGAYAPCGAQKAYSSLSEASHTVKVRAVDLGGNQDASPAERTFEVSLPPETTITSPTPSYTSHEEPPVTFIAAGSGVTFKCSLDDPSEQPKTVCSSPYTLPGHLSPGWHTFVVGSVDKSGNVDSTPAKWTFKTEGYPTFSAASTSKLVYPENGKKTGSHYTLKAKWGGAPEGGGITGVTFQMMLPKWEVFKDVPEGCTIDGKGQPVNWPLPATSNPGQTEPVYLDAKDCGQFSGLSSSEEKVKFRAVLDGGKNAAGATEAVTTEFIRIYNTSRIPTDATESVGPATVDLITGDITIKRTDVSIPVPGAAANLEFTRVYDSSISSSLPSYTTVLGSWWQPSVPVESDYEGEAWTRLKEQVVPATDEMRDRECWDEEGETVACGTGCPPESCEEWVVQEAQPEERWMELLDNDGRGITFEISGTNYIAPQYANELQLTREESEGSTWFVLSDPNGTHTTFRMKDSQEYLPKEVSFQATPTSQRMVYEPVGHDEGLRLVRIIAPAAAGVTCGDWTSIETEGCRTLKLEYKPRNEWTGGGNPEWEVLLASIRYYDATKTSQLVAQYNYGPYAELTEAWDPRLPALKEKYGYQEPDSGMLASLTPAGEKPWEFEYEFKAVVCCTGEARLKSLSRASLIESEPTATTTIAYDVPISGEGAPFNMTPESVSKWGQTDFPVDATAIFSPDHVPGSYPPGDYTDATIHYMDPDGYEVNTASPAPPGVEGNVITTSEIDARGNVVRSLGAQNRLEALGAPSPEERAQELDSHSVYDESGTRLLESWGPLHEVRLESGTVVEARSHSTFAYNEGITPEAAALNPHLVTTTTMGARIPGQSADIDIRVKKTEYDWKWLQPSAEIIDPSGLNLKTTNVYDNTTGLLKERRLPGTPGGGDARTTRTIYYTAGANSEDAECGSKPTWANLPCKTLPAAQPTPAGSNPGIPITKVAAYSNLDQPTEIKETTGGVLQRTTTKTYDAAGRAVKNKVTGTGQAIPTVETLYSPTTGKPFKQQFVCEAPESCVGFDSQATTTTFNEIGQPIQYEDADGNKSVTLYDLMGRPFFSSDGKGTQTTSYDPATGVSMQVVDSAAGTFTASYNADGQIIASALPNGLTAQTTYDETGAPVHKRYQKTSGCEAGCTWFDFDVEESIHGQWLKETANVESNEFSYDKAGRLVLTKDRPDGSSCTTRAYAYDADSNRTKLTTRAPGAGGACDTTSTGTVQNYSYDTGDRLIGSGIVYDNLGRITTLPEAFAGGSALTTSYYVNDLVRSQTQGGLTNTYDLDAGLRQRKSTQSGTKSGSTVFHYASGSDSPAWIEEGAKWTRNVGAFEGLGAIQESSGTTTLQLTDMHGDVVATASLEMSATGPLSTFSFDEFGKPKSSSGSRYGWLGGKGRRTELPSGVVQMGVRSYIPAIGRFLSPDPIEGGSANNYDYANQDPVGNIDLTGTKVRSDDCKVGAAACSCGLIVKAWNAKQPKYRGTIGTNIKFRCDWPNSGKFRGTRREVFQRRRPGGDWEDFTPVIRERARQKLSAPSSGSSRSDYMNVTRHFECESGTKYRVGFYSPVLFIGPSFAPADRAGYVWARKEVTCN